MSSISSPRKRRNTPARREYPLQPVVGVGGVIIRDGRALLVRRGGEPLKGQWSIPGGTLELGETLVEGVVRELREETGLRVRVRDLIEAFERIFPAPRRRGDQKGSAGPRYHFVILDYLCEAASPPRRARPGGDVTHVAWAREEELPRYHLTPAATRVLKKAFARARQRAAEAG